jgi:hypothetical protein
MLKINVNVGNKISSLELANRMYIDAFLIKRHKFARENPALSDIEVDKLTRHFFLNLHAHDRDKC